MIFNIKSKFKHNNFLKIIFIFLLFFTFSKISFASSKMYFTGPNGDIAPGGEFSVSLMVDTPDTMNAVDLEISYSTKNLKVLDFSNAGSIIDFWQSQPKDLGEGKIRLSGGVLSGFKGNAGLIIKIYFKALSSGQAKINFIEKSLYLADGLGTLSIPQTAQFDISIKDNAPMVNLNTEIEEYKKDTTPPNVVLTLVKNPRENSSLIVFNVTDKESGIKETQIGFKKWFSFSPWISAQNPVLYPSGAWVIELKVKNNAELESTQVLKMPWKIWKKFLMILLPIIFLVLLYISMYNKYKRIL